MAELIANALLPGLASRASTRLTSSANSFANSGTPRQPLALLGSSLLSNSSTPDQSLTLLSGSLFSGLDAPESSLTLLSSNLLKNLGTPEQSLTLTTSSLFRSSSTLEQSLGLLSGNAIHFLGFTNQVTAAINLGSSIAINLVDGLNILEPLTSVLNARVAGNQLNFTQGTLFSLSFSINNSRFQDYLSSLSRFFGIDAEQDLQNIYIRKDSLHDFANLLTPSAESLFVALLLRIKEFESGSLTSNIYIEIPGLERLTIAEISILQITLALRFYAAAVFEGFEIKKSSISPTDFED